MSVDQAKALRLIYMGTADFAVPALRALDASRHHLAAVYTQPPRPAGRGMKPRPSPVGRAAAELGLEVRTPVSLKDEAVQAELRTLDADLAVVAAYGLILPPAVLAAPRLGCINLHGSALPRWRGAAPIQRAILAGDAETGITVIQMDAGLDTGAMLARRTVEIGPRTTATALHDRLADLAARMLLPVIEDLAAGRAEAVPQPDAGVTYAAKIEKAEGRIDWERPALEIDRQLRALNPWPGCWTEFEGERLRVLEAVPLDAEGGSGAPGTILDDALTIACGAGAIRITRLQRAGGKPMASADFLRGHALDPGQVLGQPEMGRSCLATS
jgi:methionyl-tRNA formyltransferase